MKTKIFTGLAVAAILCMILSGCSFSGYRQEAAPQNIYKDYMAIESDAPADFEEQIADKAGGSVVTIISSANMRVNGELSSIVNIFSGVIINREGYVITTSQSAYTGVSAGSGRYEAEANEVYAVLPDIYDDNTHYKLRLIDYDTQIGLALFKFYDNFYFYSDAAKTDTVQGFQFHATFSSENVAVGNRCAAIGNSIGNILNGEALSLNSITQIEQTITSGFISASPADPSVFEPLQYGDSSYNYFMTSAPANLDMYGGGLFDENGYAIGILASKIVSENSGSSAGDYITRATLVYPTALVTAYIDNVSAETQKVIPYTTARLSEVEA